MISAVVWGLKLGAFGYFFYRLKMKKEYRGGARVLKKNHPVDDFSRDGCMADRRGGNGFGAGLFLALFIADAGHFLAPLIHKWFF